MSIRLLLDEDVPILLAQVLRERGLDAVHVTEVGLSGATDPTVLDSAIEQKRAVLTHNVRHFLPLMERAAEAGREHFGIRPAAQLPFGELLHRTLRAVRDRSAEDFTNAIVWLM